MFPYVCLATMPLFCNVDWPRKFVSYVKCYATLFVPQDQDISSCSKSLVALETFDESLEEEFTFATPSTTPRKSNKVASSREAIETCCEEVNSGADNETSTEIKNHQDTVQTRQSNIRTVSRDLKQISIKSARATRKRKFIVFLLLSHVALQVFLPYSHFVTKVYRIFQNTNSLNGASNVSLLKHPSPLGLQ